MVVVEVRQRRRGEDEEEEEEEEEEKKATNIKSNNPHLAGGEKVQTLDKTFLRNEFPIFSAHGVKIHHGQANFDSMPQAMLPSLVPSENQLGLNFCGFPRSRSQ